MGLASLNHRSDDEEGAFAYERRLAAIVSLDVAGYSRLMALDETDTMAALDWTRALIEQTAIRHRGRLASTAGDGFMLECGSAVAAVLCASEIQDGMQVINRDRRADRQMALRIGINIGDVILRDGDLFGDGVNIAARVQGLAQPGGIAITAAVHDQIIHKLDFNCHDHGFHQMKNIADPVRVFQLHPPTARAFWRRKPWGNGQRPAPLPAEEWSHHPRAKVLAMGLILGLVGGHRFSVDRRRSAILQALTLGGLGLWWLYDMVDLVSGDFADSHGRPVRRWLASTR
ncbi:MAG: adenylate/guanylate cyclase domain-containing protein [Alphaproteobacteria bacterium]